MVFKLESNLNQYTQKSKKNKVQKVRFQKINVQNKFKKSSQAWMARHLNDVYVHMAQKEGYKSRAAYKLLQIDEKYNILRNLTGVLDLGCLPGSWIQVFQKYINNHKIYGVDINENQEEDGYHFFCGDVCNDNILMNIQETISINAHKINLITSDIATNITGNKFADKMNNIFIFEACIKTIPILQTGGHFVFKAIAGSFNEVIQSYSEISKQFQKVYYFKPEASRKESSEMYIVYYNKIV